jgi:hypothetical protein
VRFSTRGVQKHHTQKWEKSMSKTFCKKVEENKNNSVIFPLQFFFAFLTISLHDELKNTIKLFSKITPKNLKQSQKKAVGR